MDTPCLAPCDTEKLKSFNKMRCSVAVLQFQNKLYESQKLTLYLYINI